MNTVQSMIDAAVAKANGSRRVRTVTSQDVRQAILEAHRDGYGYVRGGVVANAYKYPAVTTVVFTAKGSDGCVAVAIGVANAKKTSAPRPSWIREYVYSVQDRKADRAAMQRWADLPSTGYAEYSDGAFLLLSRTEVRRIVLDYKLESRRQRKVAAGKIDSLLATVPDVTVTYDDSINAGNCIPQTERVSRELFDGARQVNSRELIAKLAARQPHLLSYALRAVSQSASHHAS